MIWDSSYSQPSFPEPSWDEYDEWLVASLRQLQALMFDERKRLRPQFFCSAYVMAYKILYSAYKEDQQNHVSYESFSRSDYEEIKRLLDHLGEPYLETEVAFALFDRYLPETPNESQVLFYTQIAVLCYIYDSSDTAFAEAVERGLLWDREFVISELMVKIRTIILEDETPLAARVRDVIRESNLHREFMHRF